MSNSGSHERPTPKLTPAAAEFVENFGGPLWEGSDEDDDSESLPATIDKRDTEQAILDAAIVREKELLADGWVPGETFMPHSSDISYSYSLDENLQPQPISYPPAEEQLAVAIKRLEDEGNEVEVIPGVAKEYFSEYWEHRRMADELHTTDFRGHGPRPFPKIKPYRPGEFTLCGDGQPQNGCFLYIKPAAEQPAS